MILNIKQARQFLGQKLGRRGPVSEKTWRSLVDQGLPVGLLAGSKFVSSAALEAWLEEQVGSSCLPHSSTSTPRASPSASRPRGRPRKHDA